LAAMSALKKLIKEDAALVARFTGYFCGLTFIDEEDEYAYLRAADGSVFAEHQDEWVLSFDKERTRAEKGPNKPTVDPRPLKERVEWLVEVFLDISCDSDNAMKAAASYATWEKEKEKEMLAKAPHLAAYWLISHWLLGNGDALAEAIQATAKATDPVVKELREAFAVGVAGKANLGSVDAKRLESEKIRVRAVAPASLLAPAQKKARVASEKLASVVGDEENAALSLLTGAKDQAAVDSVAAFEALKARAGKPYLQLRPDGRLWPHIHQFVAAVDGRWLPILKAAYDRQAKKPDVNKKTIPGVVFGLAAACSSLDEFFAQAPESSTAAFKSDRKLEYALGVARFAADLSAIEWLAKRAEDRVRRVDEWDVPENAAYEALITTSTEAARSAVKRVLEAKEVDGRNWHFLKKAAVAAGKISAKAAKPGVQKMYDRLQSNDAWKPHLKKALEALG
jgi:hypothetical protein